jgi:hypothetical protein
MPGQAIRPSEFVLSYGVGSVIETSEGPVVIPDFEKWGKVFGKGRTPSVEQFQIPGSSMASGLLDNGLVFRIPTNADFPEPDNQPIFVTIPFPSWALCVRHSKLYELHGGRTLCNGEIPYLGLGVYQSPPGKTTRRAVRYALEVGYRHIDTTGQSNYQYFGTNIGLRYHSSGVRYSYGNVSSKHTTSADILFINKDGKPEIIFSNVQNAQDVVKLTKSIQKNRLQQLLR